MKYFIYFVMLFLLNFGASIIANFIDGIEAGNILINVALMLAIITNFEVNEYD